MRVLYVSFVVVIVDQISKLLVKGFSLPFLNLNFRGMYIGQRISLVGDYFNITFVENPGIAFGIDLGSTVKLLVSLFTLAACIILFLYLYKNRDKNLAFRLSLALIFAGALGNLIDRTFYGVIFGYAPLFYGRVVDFLNIRYFDLFILNRIFGSYVFNFADMSVTTGVVVFLLTFNKQRAVEKDDLSVMNNLLAENKD